MSKGIRKHGNWLYNGSSPYNVDDVFWSQDKIRDFRYLAEISPYLLSKLFPSVPALISGGVVTQGTGLSLNITAAFGLHFAAKSIPDSYATIPPTILSALAYQWCDLSAQTNLPAPGLTSTTYYVKMKYADTAGNTRTRLKGSGSYSYEYNDDATVYIDTVAPDGSTEILLASYTSNGTTFTITNASSAPISLVATSAVNAVNAVNATNALFSPQFDLIIDSNAKLLAWQSASSGTCNRVLIRSGTWTLASGGIDLTARGTKVVVGETGSQLVFSSTTYGLKYASAPTTNDYHMEDVNAAATGTSGACFENCVNLRNCTGSSTGTAASSSGSGFYLCGNLISCKGTGTGSGSTSTGSGFYSCTNLISCTGTGAGTGTRGTGFELCSNLTDCAGVGTGPTGIGFYICTWITLCSGLGTGAGYGFSGCHKCVNNANSSYNASYASSDNSAACADTAAGGWNS